MLPEVESRIDASPESLDLASPDSEPVAAFRAGRIARFF
jgi:hypothetical protein